MRIGVSLVFLAILVGAVAERAAAWGPTTQQAIVSTAVRVLSKEGVVQLSKLEKDVREGAAASPEVIAKLYPGYATGPGRAVESEMYLLDSVRGEVIDPYFAYRLGVLGRLVAVLTAPLLNENPTYRDRYYADVEKHIQQVALKASPRRLVDPAPYFERVQRLASARKDMIVRDYQEGLGFDGIAKSVLGEDLGRSVDAVADVWNTVLTRNVMHASVSDGQVRDYVVGALEFYIRRGSEPEIDANYRRLAELAQKTPDMAKRIGDMFYDAGFYERAIKEYEEVLAAEPGRKDVTAKIAAYYVKVGDEALAAKRLQQARDAYVKAVQTDPLHPTAEGKRLQAETLITQREARLEAARRNIEEAAQLQTQSEQLALQRKVADAMGVLKQAQAKYEAVPAEFPTELQAANAGLANIASRLSELKAELIQNAQTLSGTNSLFDIRQVAATGAGNLDEQALRMLVTHQLNAEIAKLKAESQDALRIQ